MLPKIKNRYRTRMLSFHLVLVQYIMTIKSKIMQVIVLGCLPQFQKQEQLLIGIQCWTANRAMVNNCCVSIAQVWTKQLSFFPNETHTENRVLNLSPWWETTTTLSRIFRFFMLICLACSNTQFLTKKTLSNIFYLFLQFVPSPPYPFQNPNHFVSTRQTVLSTAPGLFVSV